MKSFKTFVAEADKKDTITLDIPLLIRVLELAREDIKTDMDLHRVVERLIDIRNKGTLTMDDYNFIAKLKEEYVKEDGIGAGAVSAPGPTNTVGSGAIAGTGGAGGEPGVDLNKKKKAHNPIIIGMGHRNTPKG
jgi:hypothetical protein